MATFAPGAGIGTILNVLVVAAVIEFFHLRLPTFDYFPLKILEACAGVLIAGLGGGIYLIANLGPGPRDGLMTGLQKLSNSTLAAVRSGIEVSVVSVGWILAVEQGLARYFLLLELARQFLSQCIFSNTFVLLTTECR